MTMRQSSGKLQRLLARRSALTAVLAIVALAGPGFFLVRGSSSSQTESSTPLLAIVALVVMVAVLGVLAIVNVSTMLAGVDPDAERIAGRMVGAVDQQRLLSRWLQRTRWARNVGGFAGVVWWAVGTSTQGDLLLFGLGGVAIGSMAAQLHQIRRSPGLRTASLDRRTLGQYSRTSVRRRTAAIAVCAGLLTGAGVVYSDEVGAGATAAGVAALVVLAVAVAIQTRVASRPRPALSTGLRQADDMARILGIGKGLGEPANYWAVAIISHGVNRLEPAIGGAAVALSIVAWFYALACWWSNRRLGLDHLLKETDAANSPDSPETQSASGANRVTTT